MWIIYCATFKDGRAYVGQTMRGLQDRKHSHYKCGIKTASVFQLFLRETDPNDWKWEELKRVKTHREACHWEAYYMYERKSFLLGFNSQTGHTGKVSEATRKKMKEAKKNFVPWNKGKKGVYSEETLLAMKMAATGRTVKRSEQGEKNRLESIKKLGRPVVNIETGEEYYSVGEAARRLGVCHTTVKRVLNGSVKNSLYKLKYK